MLQNTFKLTTGIVFTFSKFCKILQRFHYGSKNFGVFFLPFQFFCLVSCAIAFKLVFETNRNFLSYAKFAKFENFLDPGIDVEKVL